MPNPKNRKTASSAKMGTDELKELIKSAVKEAMSGTKDDGATDAPLDGISTNDVLGVIEQAIEAVSEKHKADVEAGGEDNGVTTEEIVQEAAALLAELAPDEGMGDDVDEDTKDDDEDPDTKDDGDPEDTVKRRKANAGNRQVKSAAQPAPERKYANLFISGPTKTNREEKKVPPMVQLARAIKCLDVFGRNDPERAAFYAKRKYGDESMSREFKALNATSPSAGGFLIPEVYLDDVIELLYSKTIIKELGARTIPMETGNINIPRMTSGTRPPWGG